MAPSVLCDDNPGPHEKYGFLPIASFQHPILATFRSQGHSPALKLSPNPSPQSNAH